MDKPAKDILIPHDKIAAKIQEIAQEIAVKHRGKDLIVLSVLNGSVLLAADLLRSLWHEGLTDITFDTVCLRSYDIGTEATQRPKLLKDTKVDLKDRHVLIVEDIIDTGRTLTTLLELLRKRQPASLEVFALLSKPSRREATIEADYTGFVIEDLWVEGYGLDTGGKYRGNPDITYRKG